MRLCALGLMVLIAAMACAFALPAGAIADETEAIVAAELDEDEADEAAEADAEAGEEDLEKIETPTVVKEVWDGSAWTDAADAAAGETVWYRVTGTLPSNLEDFSFYAYEFHDVLDAALTVDESTVTVEIVRDGEAVEDVSSLFEVSLSEADGGRELLVATDDLLQAATELQTSDTVVLTYAASLEPGAAEAGVAVENYVYLRYTSKAFTDAFGRSTESSAELYTWALLLTKVAEDGGGALSGAGFSLQAADGRWVSADGTLSDEEVVLETGADGTLSVESLDAGTYTVSEVEAPEGYETAEPFELVVTADLSGSSPALSVEAASSAAEVEADGGEGSVSLAVADPAVEEEDAGSSALAKTGDVLSRLLPVAAGIAVAAGVGLACAARGRRREG